jgi:hypothetical protein
VSDPAELAAHFDRLISSVGRGDPYRAGCGNDAYLAIHLASANRSASARFWAHKENIAGVVELEVLDRDSEQLYWCRLDGPSIEQIDAAWADMLACLDETWETGSGTTSPLPA